MNLIEEALKYTTDTKDCIVAVGALAKTPDMFKKLFPGEKAIVVNDILASGKTVAGAAKLVERLGGKVVRMIFPVELEGQMARTKALGGYDVISMVKCPGA